MIPILRLGTSRSLIISPMKMTMMMILKRVTCIGMMTSKARKALPLLQKRLLQQVANFHLCLGRTLMVPMNNHYHNLSSKAKIAKVFPTDIERAITRRTCQLARPKQVKRKTGAVCKPCSNRKYQIKPREMLPINKLYQNN